MRLGFRWSRRLTVIGAVVLGGVLMLATQFAYRFLRGNKGPSQLLATIDDTSITMEEFRGEMVRRGGEAAYTTSRERRALLDDMIRTDVLASNARKAGYTDNPEVRRAINQLLAEKYQRDEIDQPLADLQISDGDVEEYYRSHISEFTTPESVHAAMIFIAVPPNTADDQRLVLQGRAEHIRELAARGTSFASLATQYSDEEESRGQGGDVGWLTETQPNDHVEKLVIDRLFELDNTSQLSAPITTASGIYVVKRLEGRPASLRPLSEVRNSIRQQLIRQERLQRASKLYATALTNVHMSVNDAGVAAMDAAEQAVMDLPHGSSAEPKG